MCGLHSTRSSGFIIPLKSNYIIMKHHLLLLVCFLVAISCQRSKTVLYKAPEQEKKSDDFELLVNNEPVFVYQARVSKYPINQIWPGYQRPLNQTEIASFAYFDFRGEVEIKITSNKEIKTLDIRPKEFGIKSTIKGNSIEFRLSKPSQFIVEVNGYHNALHIFANPVEALKIDKKDPKVHYFGPGIHEAGVINVKSDETVFIDGGAIVYGVINSENTRNIRIMGRGILDASKVARGEAPSTITLRRVVNASINGIILRDPPGWTAVPTNCDNITFDNIKLIGLWRYNADGIDIVNSKNVTIRNTFIRTFDDNIVIKGLKRAYNEQHNNIENIIVDNCVLWNDWGRAIEIGAETVADTIKNILFSNCYIPHFTTVAMDIQNCDRAYIEDIHFKNISIEDPISDSLRIGKTPIVKKAWGKIIVLGIYGSFYSADTIRGNISNIYFSNIRYNRTYPESIDSFGYDSVSIEKKINYKNYDIFIRDNMYFGDIRYNCTNSNNVYLSGYNNTHIVNNIFIEDYFIQGKKVTDLNLIGGNGFMKNVFIK
jgi:hypothetical protein